MVEGHSRGRSSKRSGHFRNDDAATKLLWLALRSMTLKWVATATGWPAAMNHFAILYGDRFTRDAQSSTRPAHKIPDTPDVLVQF
jgi:hypothetical protein